MKFYLKWEERIGPVLYLNVLGKTLGLCFCHRKKERSFHYSGLENVLCSRCLGILTGCITGIIMRVLGYYIPVIIMALVLLPLILDGLHQAISQKESRNFIRFCTGLFGGIGITFLADFIAGFIF